MSELECKYKKGCVVQQLSTALEDLPFMDQMGERAAVLGDPGGVIASSFQKGELIDAAEDLANINPCITCSQQLCAIHDDNRKKLNELR